MRAIRNRAAGARARATVLACAVGLAGGCATPGRARLADTSTAQTRAVPTVAPAASTSDREREHAVQQMDHMEDAQQAHHEAREPVAPLTPLPASAPAPAPVPALALPGSR